MKLKLRMKKLLFIALAAVFCLSALPGGAFSASKPKTVSAAEGVFKQTTLSIPNGQFGENSGSYPGEPSQWTGEPLNGSSTAKMYGGVISMNHMVYNFNNVLEEYHLGDGVDVPKNPFSRGNSEDSKEQALMINTKDASAAYAYMSPALTLEANACYEISAWVLTLPFKESGASIRLVDAETHLSIGRKANTKGAADATEKLMAFRNIDTSGYNVNPQPGQEDMKNWREYRFNVQTSFTPLNIKVSLSVGDDGREDGVKTKGIAFFDNVTGKTIKRSVFEEKALTASSDFLSYSFEEEMKGRGKIETPNTSLFANGDFTDGADGLDGWEWIDYTKTDEKGNRIYGKPGQSNANNRQRPRVADLNEDYVISPFTKTEPGFENTALKISHPADEEEEDKSLYASASGIISSPFTLQRFRHYRLSVWFLTLYGAQANIYLSMPDDSTYSGGAPRKYLGDGMKALSSAENVNTENWQQVSFYIKGSSVEDYKGVALELWLGYGDFKDKSAYSTGTVYFDKIEIQYLDTGEYAKYSPNGTALSLDEFAAAPAVANGNFTDIEYTDIEDYFKIDGVGNSSVKKPFSPASWTFVNGQDKGLNPKAVDFDYNDTAVTRGVIASSEGPKPDSSKPRTVLQVQNAWASAAGYSSQDISLSTNSYQKISVWVYTGQGAKAFLQLTEGSNPVALIENIDTRVGMGADRQWINYSFIVWAGDSVSLKLTLWNGWCSEKAYEPYKNLSQGAVWFAAVDSQSSNADDYDKYSDGSDKTVKTVDLSSNFGLFDNSSGALKVPYRYTVSGTGDPDRDFSGGIFDAKNFSSSDGEIPFNPKTSNDELFRYVLMANNRVLSAFKYTSVKSFTLSSSSYYKVTVSVKTAQLSGASGHGAYIGLAGIKNASISGIKSDDKYTTYTFYIATGNESLSFNYEMGLGDVKRTSTYTKGFAFFDDISYQTISLVEYNNAGTEKAVKLSFLSSETAAAENDVGKGFWDWYWLPTLLFGLALLFVLVILAVRKLVPVLAEAFGTWRRNRKAASYDRESGSKAAPKRRPAATTDDEGYIDVVENVRVKPVSDAPAGDKPEVSEETQEAKTGGAYDDYFED